jgi:hypothetical protein
MIVGELTVEACPGSGVQRISPPSTTMVWPTTWDANGKARNNAAHAMSAGAPNRFSGIRSIAPSLAGHAFPLISAEGSRSH